MKKLGNKPPDNTILATYGGEGWLHRQLPLRDDIANGNIWHPCGYQSECASLKEVVLSWPGKELEYGCAPNEMLMLARPDVGMIQAQTLKLADFYKSHGVKVHIARPSSPPPPNFLFQRDLFWASPEGVVLARPASVQRAGEERYSAEVLAGIGVPIVMHFHGNATFEGADALWLERNTVMLGTGVRTNGEAARQLGRFLREFNVELIEIPLPKKCQHLLGIVNFIDVDLAAVHGGKITHQLSDILSARKIRTILLPDNDDLNVRQGMNFVTLAPGKIVMPKGAPGVKASLEDHGIEAYEVEISEYLKAAGGLACLTGILRRD
ncbi:MAG: arginine deiminase family protein [Pseudomonadota bacterium]